MTDYQPKSPQEELIRAGHAKQIIESPLFIEMRQTIEAQLLSDRRSVSVRDTDMHTRLIITEKLWGYIMDWFEQVAQTGRMAEVQIQQERSLRERFTQGIQRGFR